MTADVKDVLNQRQGQHGDFSDNARVTEMLMSVVRGEDSFETLPPVMKTSLFMILHKIGRILSGDPFFEDHWTDVEGYTRLVRERLPGGSIEMKRKEQLERFAQVKEAMSHENHANIHLTHIQEENPNLMQLRLQKCEQTEAIKRAMENQMIAPPLPGERHKIVTPVARFSINECCLAKKDNA